MDRDYITCMLCGGSYKSLTSHIGRTHKVSVYQYQMDFPGAPVVSPELSEFFAENTRVNCTGKPFTEEHLKNMSESRYEYYAADPSIAERIAETLTGKDLGETHRINVGIGCRRAHELDPTISIRQSESHKKNWRNPDYVRKMIKSWGSKLNGPESTLLELLESRWPGRYRSYLSPGLQSLVFSWGYLGRRVPDMVRVDGVKQVIFSNGSHWHDDEAGERMVKDFEGTGIDCVILWADNWGDVVAEWTNLVSRLESKTEGEVG